MHNLQRNRQRGEGKLGCIVSLLIFVTLVAAAWQLIPVYYSNNGLVNGCESVAARAVTLSQDNIQLQIRDKARELGIQEAMEPGAIVVTKVGGTESGTCTVKLNYTRKVDFYGVYSYDLKTEKTLVIPYLDATR